MSEPLPLGLAQQEKARPMDPDQLEGLGKKAAALYQESGMPLTEAVVEVVKEAMLAPEQVRRVCEFANTSAYLSAFEKAGSVRNITFEGGPADPARVLQDLNDGSSPTLLTGSSDYKKTASLWPPLVSNRRMAEMNALAQLFQVEDGLAKTAGADHQKHASPIDDLWDTRQTLEAMRDDLVEKVSGAQLVFDTVRNDLCKQAEQEILDGAGFGELLQIFTKLGSKADVEHAALAIRDHLVAHGHTSADIAGSLRKTASDARTPNLGHPLVVKFSAFVKAAHAIKVVDLALQDTKTQLQSIGKSILGAVT